MRITSRRTAAALVLLVLATSPASAAGHRTARLANLAGGGLFDRAWSWLAELADLAGWTSLRGESGGYMDPNGGTTSTAAPAAPAGASWTSVRGEEGSYMDLDGRTAPQVAAPSPSAAPSKR